jgi:hypothetical protein
VTALPEHTVRPRIQLDAPGVTARPRWSGVRAILLCGFLVLCLVPADFVRLTATWDRVDEITLLVTAVLGALCILHDRRLRVKVLLSSVGLVATASLASADPGRAAYFILPFLIGIGVAAVVDRRGARLLLATLAGVLVLSVLVDAAGGGPVTSSVFGLPNQLSALTGTRARGLLGQPVPAAFASVFLFATLLPAAAGIADARRRLAAIAALAGAVVVTLALTGTRSALVLALVVGAVFLIRYAVHRGVRFVGPLLLASPALIAVGLLLAVRFGSDFRSSRIGDFDSLSGSTSLLNRLLATEYLGRWANSGDALVILIGGGPRDLQETLSAYRGNYLSTIDNFFVTLLWDFGLLGALLMLVIIVMLLRKLRSTDALVVGAAMGGLTLIASGLAFDVFYVRPMALLFGLVIGVCLGGAKTIAPKGALT